MDPRITSIENLIASDPSGRNVFGLLVAGQLRLAAQSLNLARRVGIVTGFFIPEAGAGETDGPPGAKVLGQALEQLGIDVDYITDAPNAPVLRSLDLEPILDAGDYLDRARPTHLVSVERVGRGVDGRYRNMAGIDITDLSAPLDELFLDGGRRGLTTIGVGDGGNEIGMGKVFAEPSAYPFDPADTPRSMNPAARCVVATDFCIAAGVSNWGAFGLAGALSILCGRDLLPSADTVARDLERCVMDGGAVDGVTHRHEPTTDGLELSATLRMLEQIRRHIAPSPLERGSSCLVGVLGYGVTGRATVALVSRCGHRVRISDRGPVKLDPGVQADGVEAGGHTIDFLDRCDVVAVSPGVRPDSPIIAKLHRRGIPIMSAVDVAYQLRTKLSAVPPFPLIAVTGTIGKRTTVELLERLFQSAGRSLAIGGNRGRPLAELLLDHRSSDPIALAVSSFQLESVVHFRPEIAVLLNIDREHLDRHRSVAEYARIKSRIFMNHRPDNALILPFDDPRLRTLSRKHHGRTYFFSTRQTIDRGAWLTDGLLKLNVDGSVETIGPAAPAFPENLLSSVLVARLCGVSVEQIARFVQHPAPTGGATLP